MKVKVRVHFRYIHLLSCKCAFKSRYCCTQTLYGSVQVLFTVGCMYSQLICPGTNCCVGGGSPTASLGILLLDMHSLSSELWHL